MSRVTASRVQGTTDCLKFATEFQVKLQNENLKMSRVKLVVACREQQIVYKFDSHTEFQVKRSFDNSNENRYNSRRDHDITMAHGCNNKVPAKLIRWPDRADYRV